MDGACDTLGEVRGWDKGRRAKGNVCTIVSEAHIAMGMQKGWDLCDAAHQEVVMVVVA